MMRTRAWIVVLLAACLGLGGCGYVRLNAVGASIAPDAAPAESYEIGEIKDGWAIVEARINGHGPHRLLLDTGASISLLSPGLFDSVGLRHDGRGSFRDIHGLKDTFEISRADSVRLGPVELTGLPMIASSIFDGFDPDLGIVGLIGYHGLDRFTLDLDYEAGVVRVSEVRLDPDAPGVIEMVARRSATPVVNLTHVLPDNAGTHRVAYGIDSGGGGFALSLDGPSRRRLVDAGRMRVIGGGWGLNGPSPDSRIAPLRGAVVLGEHELRGVPVNLENAHTLIGAMLLSKFRVQIDPVSGLVRFTSRGRGRTTGSVRQRYGVGVLDCFLHDGGWVIRRVGDQTPAMRAGLRPGDRVVKIDGEAASGAEAARKLHWVFSEPRDIRLLVDRDGERLEIITGMEKLFPDDAQAYRQRGADLTLPTIELDPGGIVWD